jgi:hypothetical protein
LLKIPLFFGGDFFLFEGLGRDRDQRMLAYRPMRIKTPAVIARMAMRVPSPEKLRLSSGINPVKMSQILNKSMPRFLGSFI